MGYFSNGTEGQIYQDQYCRRCIYYGPPEGPGCPVWGAHLFYSYELCNVPAEESPGKAILDMLIPMSPDRLSNEQCRMFQKAEG